MAFFCPVKSGFQCVDVKSKLRHVCVVKDFFILVLVKLIISFFCMADHHEGCGFEVKENNGG